MNPGLEDSEDANFVSLAEGGSSSLETTKGEEVSQITTLEPSEYVSPKMKPVAPRPTFALRLSKTKRRPPPPPPPPSLPPTRMMHMPPPPPPPPMQPPPPDIRIARMGSLEFKQNLTFSAIEVLLEEPRVTMRSRQKNHPSRHMMSHYTNSSEILPITKPNPKKIRVRSRELLILLEEIAKMSGHSFTAKSIGPYTNDYLSTVFLYPFKFFAGIEPDVRTKLTELEGEVEAEERELAKQQAIEEENASQIKVIEEKKASEETKTDINSDTGKEGHDRIKVQAKQEEATADDSLDDEGTHEHCSACGHKLEISVVDHSDKSITDGTEDDAYFPPLSPPQYIAEFRTPSKKEMLHQLKLLVEVLDSDLQPMFDLRREIREGTLVHIAFQDLWHLFEIGQDVKTSDTEPQVYRVIRWTGGRPDFAARPSDRSNLRTESWNLNLIVDCAYSDFDGNFYTPIQKTFAIRKYDGERAITSLPIFPLAFDPDHVKLRKQLSARGNTWLQLTQADQSTHKHYTGLTLDEPQPNEIDSQIIVDTKMAMLHYYKAPPPTGVSNLTMHNPGETQDEHHGGHPKVYLESIHQDHDWDLQYEQAFFEEHKSWLAPTADPDDIEEEDKLLLPPHVLGFVLRSRKWARFNVDLIRPVSYTSGFDALVLPDGHKETVRALVANHARLPSIPGKSSQTKQSIDLVRGKGEGLVILLHGAPGVGKTSTAECVADNTKRPLFPITCGDIGDTATDVERNLESSFQLAHKWGCVLLLDEADIFLQKRDKADIKRNAIVSVFLRTLEYYSGILFLTTNRVGTFDPAFRSRIHVSLYYPPLKKDATMQIWKMHLSRTQDLKGKDLKINTKEILKFAKEHYHDLKKEGAGSWNGRQIRNAFQTAIALAEFRAGEEQEKVKDGNTRNSRVELSRKHFDTVAQASRDFDMYLQRTLGGQNEADLARNEQTRIDDFHPPKGYTIRHEGHGQRGKTSGKKRVKVEPDSEESEGRDSEDSGESMGTDEDSKSGKESESESESESEEEVPVKKSKKKQR